MQQGGRKERRILSCPLGCGGDLGGEGGIDRFDREIENEREREMDWFIINIIKQSKAGRHPPGYFFFFFFFFFCISE